MADPFYTVALNGQPVTDPVATFDIARRTVDVFVLNGDTIQTKDGEPVTRQLTGEVSLIWSAAAMAMAADAVVPVEAPQ